ncbi:MAG: hypothetical protein KF871_18405 [Hydrogenophaga sp.]|uniref:hypothetical protein n=1 Tax=Hydrogenophaga sp. TaxID=1904254 RepID=UPI001E0D10D2|nr:hypothetical protein [Hydrogenophaga sp.]MBX3611870.1 hypothetical protein [Hydrogenophaga sp.]
MFPIMMDEPESMKVKPVAWQMLQDAWRGAQRPVRRDVKARREATSPNPTPSHTPLAALAFGVVEPTPGHRG